MSEAKVIALNAMKQGGEEIPVTARDCKIDMTHEDEAARQISKAVNHAIPGLYDRGGDVVQVAEVDNGNGAQLVIRPIDADGLRMLLAQTAYCYRTKMMKGKDGALIPVEVPGLPSVPTTRAVLTQNTWSGLDTLAGVAAMPIVRSDGTILTDLGYDKATRLYHRPALAIGPIPDRPSLAEVSDARMFVFDYVLADFCWDSDASKANYFALLMTPLMRLFVGGLPPFGLVSATTRGSGKTLLVEIMRAAYGVHMTPWVRKEEEFKKTITSILRDTTSPAICFDNVNAFDTLDHGALSMLLTQDTWSERVLGVSNMFTGINDRLWCATGNNLAVGGDVASRSVMTRLDPNMERPEERTGFVIDDMWAWLEIRANRVDLLRSLLILARAWIVAGAERDTAIKMRNFSAWAQVMGGLTAYHEVSGFLANRDKVTTSADDEETSTAAFIAKWWEKFQANPKRATELVDSARVDTSFNQYIDPWDGTFPATFKDGRSIPFSSKGLGKFLTSRDGRIFGGLKLIREYNTNTKVWAYKVIPHNPEGQS